MSEARHILEQYLSRIGMSRPKDSAQQFAVTLRQWTEHLDEVLTAEDLPGDVRARIIRAMIYGGAPTLAEAEVREQMFAEMVKLAEHGIFPRMTGGQ